MKIDVGNFFTFLSKVGLSVCQMSPINGHSVHLCRHLLSWIVSQKRNKKRNYGKYSLTYLNKLWHWPEQIITNFETISTKKKIILWQYSVQNFIKSGEEFGDKANIYYTPRKIMLFTEPFDTKLTVDHQHSMEIF